MQILDQHSYSFLSNNNSPQKSNQNSIKITQKCIGNNIIKQFCINNKCQSEQKFLCQDDQCQCNQNHQLCQKGMIRGVLKQIGKKLTINMDKLKTKISDIFTELVNRISLFEENLFKELDNNLKYLQLTEIQQAFYEIFKEQKNENIKYFDKSNKLISLWQTLREKQQKRNRQSNQLIINYFQKIKIYKQKSIKDVEIFQKSINQLVEKFTKCQQKKEKQNKQKLSQQRLLYLNFIFPAFSSSQIITNQVQLNSLISFFPHRISSINLLFKASLHNFSIKKYFQTCGNIQNTIILCETTKNKIIGGYTPLSFNPSLSQISNTKKQQQQKWIETADHSFQSFVFSLTNNDRFQLKQPHKAIIKSSNKQCINFGWGLLSIADKANGAQNSQTIKNMTVLWNTVYQNKKYKNDKTSYLLLNGNTNQFFIAKQWEVFKVQFSS